MFLFLIYLVVQFWPEDMDIFDVLLQAGLVTTALVLYLIFFRKQSTRRGHYREPGWNYPLKLLAARYAVKQWKSKWRSSPLNELPREGQYEGWDNIAVRASAPDGSTILLGMRKLCGRQGLAEITVHLKLSDGVSYRLSRHPDTAVGAWESIPDGWSAMGLKIQVLEPETRLRILFNGLLTRTDNNETQHVKLNLIWTSATAVVRYPEDWSNELAAEALAVEPWRDDKWPSLLGKWEESGWLQWGVVQGRFQTYDVEGAPDKSIFLQQRGVRERNWAPHGYEGLRRSVSITTTAHDGTAIQLKALSYKNVLTQCISGSVRLPNFDVESITCTDMYMPDFCETADVLPKVYTINVSTKSRDLKLVIRINDDGGKLYSGVPYQQSIVYRTMFTDIDGERGSGILELGYEPLVISQPSVSLSQPRLLKWLSEKEAGDVGYCLPFEDRAAACSNYVGGKGASLALLCSFQKEEGYRVPPGYCLTIKALEKHLERNSNLRAAIKEIEAANENYEENCFKEKCAKASELFSTTEISGDIRDEIISNLNNLRSKAKEQNLGPELRFAVRSSAVGEDSEALSAAGQNETILGCISDADVLKGVQKCWGSMFAFTSAYYRRQNGQPCLCGGGVVVQALVTPRSAGVMFTRHPDAGDPSRLLITANYGLGESVVSGAVEPDTIFVKRGNEGRLTISKIELGSKTQRVKAVGDGVIMEDVPEADRRMSCLSETDVLRLAQLGVSQEELWGAGRDIEWAICENEIFLLQARPITSLERWSEEELLHELDFPIMADDELTTFGNTGEVLPKPLTPFSYDLVLQPLTGGMDIIVPTKGDGYEQSIGLTHNRCILNLYTTVYRKVPNKKDLGIRMLEMAIHGHKVADDKIISTAMRRRQHRWWDFLRVVVLLIKTISLSKFKMNDSIKKVRKININTESNDAMEMLNIIADMNKEIKHISYNHGLTTTASTATQFISMSVLLEGNPDFTTEQCNEISELLSSGDVLSAEVPQALAHLAGQLEKSGLADDFRAQDPKTALSWLKNNLPEVYDKVSVFLEQHGHRAIMEFDLFTKPWVLVPEDMMKVLQSMRHTKEASRDTKSNVDVIANLKSPKKSSTRKVLRWVVPLCKRTVRHREGTKSQLILGIHKLRLACIYLGRLLVQQWYIPNPDLVFFFRVHELRSYIKTRDPALLKKAIQRQQYYPGWCKLKFQELNEGWVKPLEVSRPLITTSDVKIKATSVCGGEVIARACVVKDLSEINELQQGDILITHATDIGWSPYFPLLTGIVTELGGLISHGAVIAREYGLPCIVGAGSATDIFKTGDMVQLSGTHGTLERVQMAETNKPEDTFES